MIALATIIMILHYVISLWVYFCLPALGERILLYEIFIQWHDPTQHGYTFIYPRLGVDGSSIATMVIIIALRYTIWSQVYFYLPMFRGGERYCNYNCDCDRDYYSTLHNSVAGILLPTRV